MVANAQSAMLAGDRSSGSSIIVDDGTDCLNY